MWDVYKFFGKQTPSSSFFVGAIQLLTKKSDNMKKLSDSIEYGVTWRTHFELSLELNGNYILHLLRLQDLLLQVTE